jgi:N-carbamoyl-L-amino-acid hydrolase
MDTIDVNAGRTVEELEKLATFSDAPAPAVTRVLFTPQDLAGRAYLKSLFADAGLTVREDAVGNTFARWVGSDPREPAVATGSHADAIPHSGRYDGTVGVLGALEAIRSLRRAGFEPARSIEIVLFTSEEPTRFGLGCLGSRLLTGSLDPVAAAALLDGEGQTLEQVRADAGYAGPLTGVRLPIGRYDAFVELHTEQGPLLERGGIDVGVVTAIAAPATLRMMLHGASGHAGATLMPGRRDALCAAAEITLAVERAATESGSPDSVGTVGICRIHPGNVNAIPATAMLEVDVRDTRQEVRDRMVGAIRAAADAACARRNVGLKIEVLNADPPCECDPDIVRAVEESAGELKYSARRMVSRAYHDSLFMARIAPTGMIFIPCRDGISHRPDEFASPDAIAKGVAVLAGTLARLSRIG